MSKAFALFTTGLEVYAFYLVIENSWLLLPFYFNIFLYYVYRIRRGIKKNFGQKLA